MAEKHVHKVYGSFPPWGKSVEFPASGGGGGLTYFDVRSLYGENLRIILGYACIVKEMDGSGILFTPIGFSTKENPIAVGINLNIKISFWDEDVQEYNGVETIESEIKRGVPWILELPRLTEEEFYGL